MTHSYLTEQQVEEFLYINKVRRKKNTMDSLLERLRINNRSKNLTNFDYVSEDLSDLIEEEKFNVNDYLMFPTLTTEMNFPN